MKNNFHTEFSESAMHSRKRFGVIIAGGSGERFWPASRATRPKHLCDITGAGMCLLEQCFRRLSRLVPEENILVVTNRAQLAETRTACPFIPTDRIVCEPEGRDTLAAVALGAFCAERFSGERDVLVATFPADHLITDEANFVRTAETAFAAAEGGNVLVTIGIVPTFPATGYGYIQSGALFRTGNPPCMNAEKFHEKPNETKAREYLAQGNFYWNAGMFFWKSSSLRTALERFAPDCAQAFRDVSELLNAGVSLEQALTENYPKIEKRSVDFGIMEKADNVKVVPAMFDWDDAGTWAAAERHFPKDGNGNIFRGNVFCEATNDCSVFDDGTGRTTVLLGTRDLIVVHENDATLICSRENVEKLKTLVKKLPEALR